MSPTVLTVLSSDSMDYYPDNTVARFRNNIDLQLDPDKRYVACLHSISFVRSWYNFLRSESYSATYVSRSGSRNRIVIPPGYYNRNAFNRIIKNKAQLTTNTMSYDRSCVITFEEATYRFKVTFTRTMSINKKLVFDQVVLSPDLARKLGFGDGSGESILTWDNHEDTQIFYSTHPVNFDPIDFFCVSSSLIKPTHNIGKHMYRVLALVPSKRGYGTRKTHAPRDPLWFEVSSEEIRQPEFILTTLMPFEFGTSSITLMVKEFDGHA